MTTSQRAEVRRLHDSLYRSKKNTEESVQALRRLARYALPLLDELELYENVIREYLRHEEAAVVTGQDLQKRLDTHAEAVSKLRALL